MSFEELIIKFLNINFEVCGFDNLMIRDKSSGKLNNPHSMVRYIQRLFTDTPIDDEGKTSVYIFSIWLSSEEDKLLEPVKKYLDTCNVRLGIRSWDTYSENNELVTTEFLFSLSEKVTIGYVKRYFDDWQEERVYTESERIMNNY